DVLVLHSFPTRRSSDLFCKQSIHSRDSHLYLSDFMIPNLSCAGLAKPTQSTPPLKTVPHVPLAITDRNRPRLKSGLYGASDRSRSEEHTSELQSLRHLV